MGKIRKNLNTINETFIEEEWEPLKAAKVKSGKTWRELLLSIPELIKQSNQPKYPAQEEDKKYIVPANGRIRVTPFAGKTIVIREVESK